MEGLQNRLQDEKRYINKIYATPTTLGLDRQEKYNNFNAFYGSRALFVMLIEHCFTLQTMDLAFYVYMQFFICTSYQLN